MFRIAKPESFVLISPSKIQVCKVLRLPCLDFQPLPSQVGKQNAAECMPLIMEPASAFYTSPLLVLDFQSLYPSIMIAYNYCYSTCLGRVTEFQGRYKFGVVENLDISYDVLHKLQDHITSEKRCIFPCHRRDLIVPQLLQTGLCMSSPAYAKVF